MDTFRAADLPDPEELVSARRAVLQEAKVRGIQEMAAWGVVWLVRFSLLTVKGIHIEIVFILSIACISSVH